MEYAEHGQLQFSTKKQQNIWFVMEDAEIASDLILKNTKRSQWWAEKKSLVQQVFQPFGSIVGHI